MYYRIRRVSGAFLKSATRCLNETWGTYRCSVNLPQKNSRVKIAAARNTLESLWRPSKALWSLPGGRRIDSVYAKTTLAHEGG
ncbi:hypothetical protein PoB_001343400 [Plakobranchus ocellatus]|uniref:Uncharacterized protein n=1 Tax=Plakobranchus ocellatus TaxID=259542 RepID=A0AAV3YXV5_9GAST|nr:hypothetical protein PoB_001343400 [Plakobranchus ocellatus]